jgi:membrane protein YdbS with pleckstrin-like domain
MPFPRKLLNSYEEVALDLHPHWSYFYEPLLGIVVAVALAIVLLALTGVTIWVPLVLVLLALVWLGGRYIRWVSTHFVVTTDRVIYREGVIGKRGIEMPLERVNNVSLNQSILQRIVGAGDLLVESGGEDGQQHFTDIRRPEDVQNVIHAQIEENNSRVYQGSGLARDIPGRAAPGGGPPDDVTSQLERLEGLLQRGTITRQEFDIQKQRLLGTLPPPGQP